MISSSSSPSPRSISIPPPPGLEPENVEEETNTLALLLPNQSLFEPQILSLLKEHYNLFGEIIHWAPIKGFGRVLIVFKSNEDAKNTKKLGDWLKLDLSPSTPNDVRADAGGNNKNQSGNNDHAVTELESQSNQIPQTNEQSQNKDGYFTPKTKIGKRQSQVLKSHELILRLHSLPPTPINPDPSTIHLAPPSLPHNFLISPPGSPPEGWEQIAEEGPNTSILAEDLQRALESLQLNGGYHKNMKNGKEVILDEGGVRVEVEDTTKQENNQQGTDDKWDIDIEETLDPNMNHDIWNSPSQQNIQNQLPSIAGGGLGSLGGLGGSFSGSNTPSGKIKIAPTARPPM
ncbi:uncharacterized protein L201_007105 [Kwoniella dendrophila CBS 6074]|uniref:Calcineurin-binding protein n=1 Tax=Kwoniella dendrophila CBS 6074 TaxID=1295534 RepID=A0AAX4K3H9_9TREE